MACVFVFTTLVLTWACGVSRFHRRVLPEPLMAVTNALAISVVINKNAPASRVMRFIGHLARRAGEVPPSPDVLTCRPPLEAPRSERFQLPSVCRETDCARICLWSYLPSTRETCLGPIRC